MTKKKKKASQYQCFRFIALGKQRSFSFAGWETEAHMIMAGAFRAPCVCRHFQEYPVPHNTLPEVDVITAILQRKTETLKVGSSPTVKAGEEPDPGPRSFRLSPLSPPTTLPAPEKTETCAEGGSDLEKKSFLHGIVFHRPQIKYLVKCSFL